MKPLSFLAPLLLCLPLAALAQTQIWRCGEREYTNTVTEAQKPHCKLVEGGNVTIVQGMKPPAAAAAPATTAPVKVANASPTSAGRVDSAEQKARDADSRRILESELKRAEARHAELLQEYNNGEPEKRGGEASNYQKYLDRVADLKASIARNQSDIAGIQRELGRLTTAK